MAICRALQTFPTAVYSAPALEGCCSTQVIVYLTLPYREDVLPPSAEASGHSYLSLSCDLQRYCEIKHHMFTWKMAVKTERERESLLSHLMYLKSVSRKIQISVNIFTHQVTGHHTHILTDILTPLKLLCSTLIYYLYLLTYLLTYFYHYCLHRLWDVLSFCLLRPVLFKLTATVTEMAK